MNASAAYDKLNRCLQDVKEWMSASKLKLNPDKTEFILFGSKKQREKFNACFPIDILANPLDPNLIGLLYLLYRRRESWL